MIDRYREWYEHECDCNDKMLAMIESIPESNRSDPKYPRALVLAAHLSACRENWLDRMVGGGAHQTEWWPEDARPEDLRPRYHRMQQAWTAYLANLSDDELDRDFEFEAQGGRYRWSIEGQIVQLVGHAFYHRGQVALLVSELGGTPVDTDYLYWAYDRNPRWGKIS